MLSWLGLRHKGVEVLFPSEWNAVVDGLDILKSYIDQGVKSADLTNLSSDVIPSEDNKYNIGDPLRAWHAIYAHYGFFLDNAYVQGKQVLKDGDPVIVQDFTGNAKNEIDSIYNLVEKPSSLQTYRLSVSTTPIPLSNVDQLVKRIHIKVPSWAFYLIYVGDQTSQDYVLEPSDRDVFEIDNPRKIYVRSIGDVTIFIALEK